LDLAQDTEIYSNWINDEDIPPTKVTFSLGGTFKAGFYYFTIASNIQIRETCSFSLEDGGIFLGKFLKKEFGAGSYKTDQALFMEVRGSWTGTLSSTKVVERDALTISSIQDGS